MPRTIIEHQTNEKINTRTSIAINIKIITIIVITISLAVMCRRK